MEKNIFVALKTTLIVDALFILLVYFTPVIAHTISFPVYLLDPMRWCVLGSYLLLRNRNNALLLAFSLPLISYMFSGHPVLFKNMLISIELMSNIILLEVLLMRFENVFVSVLLSIMVSKLVYYLLKAFIISLGILHTNIIDTTLLFQVVVSILISLLFTKYYRK